MIRRCCLCADARWRPVVSATHPADRRPVRDPVLSLHQEARPSDVWRSRLDRRPTLRPRQPRLRRPAVCRPDRPRSPPLRRNNVRPSSGVGPSALGDPRAVLGGRHPGSVEDPSVSGGRHDPGEAALSAAGWCGGGVQRVPSRGTVALRSTSVHVQRHSISFRRSVTRPLNPVVYICSYNVSGCSFVYCFA